MTAAEAGERESIEAFRRKNNEPQAVQVEVGLVETYIWAGRYAEAEAAAGTTYTNASRLTDMVGRQKLVADSLTLYAQLYDAWKKPEQAAEYRQRLEKFQHPEVSMENPSPRGDATSAAPTTAPTTGPSK